MNQDSGSLCNNLWWWVPVFFILSIITEPKPVHDVPHDGPTENKSMKLYNQNESLSNLIEVL